MPGLFSGGTTDVNTGRPRIASDGALQRRTVKMGRVSRGRPVYRVVRNCTRDEGGPFEAGSQVLASSHCKLRLPKAMVVSVAEKPGQDPGRHD